MKRTKIISIALISLILCGICLLAAGCPDKDNSKKYDVSMKIVCKEVVNGNTIGPILDEWIFTPNNDEMNINRAYDGKKYKFYLAQYESPNYISPHYQWVNIGDEVHTALWMEGKPKDEIYEYVCEKGEYTLFVYACCSGAPQYLWNTRTLKLHISVK